MQANKFKLCINYALGTIIIASSSSSAGSPLLIIEPATCTHAVHNSRNSLIYNNFKKKSLREKKITF